MRRTRRRSVPSSPQHPSSYKTQAHARDTPHTQTTLSLIKPNRALDAFMRARVHKTLWHNGWNEKIMKNSFNKLTKEWCLKFVKICIYNKRVLQCGARSLLNPTRTHANVRIGARVSPCRSHIVNIYAHEHMPTASRSFERGLFAYAHSWQRAYDSHIFFPVCRRLRATGRFLAGVEVIVFIYNARRLTTTTTKTIMMKKQAAASAEETKLMMCGVYV